MLEGATTFHRPSLSSVTRRTSRLVLRPPVLADLPIIRDTFSRDDLVAHRPDPRPDTHEDSEQRLHRDMAHWMEHGVGRWAALADDQTIGFGGVTVSQEFGGLNVSYHLHPDHWGKGYATELVAEAIQFAFQAIRANRIVGLVRSANPATRRVLERNGFVFERQVIRHGATTDLYGFNR